MEKILVLTDFSPFSDYATKLAIDLAKRLDANILLAHVIEGSVDWDKLPPEKKELYPKLQEKISQQEKKLTREVEKARSAGVIADYEIVVSDHFINFKNFIRHNMVDLIVLGAHGEKGITDKHLGRHSQKTLRNATCPVLVVPDVPEGFEINKIAFASNFKENAMDAFDTAAGLAKNLGKQLELLYINTPVSFEDTLTSLKRIENFRGKYEDLIIGETIFNHFTEEEGIVSYVKEAGIDLIIMPTHGRKGLLNFISGSLTETVISHAPIPVISYQLEE